jgi:hypothetical protein
MRQSGENIQIEKTNKKTQGWIPKNIKVREFMTVEGDFSQKFIDIKG